jgi:hypothetical protein
VTLPSQALQMIQAEGVAARGQVGEQQGLLVHGPQAAPQVPEVVRKVVNPMEQSVKVSAVDGL